MDISNTIGSKVNHWYFVWRADGKASQENSWDHQIILHLVTLGLLTLQKCSVMAIDSSGKEKNQISNSQKPPAKPLDHWTELT